MEYTWKGAGRLPGPAGNSGCGRRPNSSKVLPLGVAVKATYVMPASLALAAICTANRSSVPTSPPSASSLSSSALSSCLSLLAASPVWLLCASSAITAKRFPCVAASSCTALSANGKVWIVQTTIFCRLPKLLPAQCFCCRRRL